MFASLGSRVISPDVHLLPTPAFHKYNIRFCTAVLQAAPQVASAVAVATIGSPADPTHVRHLFADAAGYQNSNQFDLAATEWRQQSKTGSRTHQARDPRVGH